MTQLRRINGEIIAEGDKTIRELAEENCANLQEADLRGADLWGADLREADLRGADLRGANLDFACWPLWCGSFGVRFDKRIAAQLALHFVKIVCDDNEVRAAQTALLPVARQSHRWCEE